MDLAFEILRAVCAVSKHWKNETKDGQMGDLQIKCRIVKVNSSKTKCQDLGKTYPVDDMLSKNLCPKAYAVVMEAVAEIRLKVLSGTFPNTPVNIPCPEGYVIYQLFISGNGEYPSDKSDTTDRSDRSDKNSR